MTRLDDYVADDSWTQFGEAGIRDHLLDRIGVKHRVCVEFGAGDGLSCSNTAHLWRNNGWLGFLVESDHARFETLEGNARAFNTICRRAVITPSGPDSISALLTDHGITEIDFMSIDIDGDDYFVLAALEVRPRIVVVEFNPTVPPHIELRQRDPGGTFGASLLAVARLAPRIGYRFVGANYCNAFLVVESEAAPFDKYDTDPERLRRFDQYTYAVTDFAGRVTLAGQVPPWGARDPYVRPLEGVTYLTPPADNPQLLRRGFESLWGPALWLPMDGINAERLDQILADGPHLVCFDLTNQSSLDTVRWLWDGAEAAGYTPLLAGRVLGLIQGSI